MEPNQKVNNRILVLGSAPHTRMVAAYTWDKAPEYLNIADYDVVILNFVPFLNEEFAHNHIRRTYFSVEQYARLLFSEGSEVIAIGVPQVGTGGSSSRNLMAWLPVAPVYILESGETIRDVKPEFEYYFRHVGCWSFYTKCERQEGVGSQLSDYLHTIHPGAHHLQPDLQPIAQTRFQQPIAFELHFQAMSPQDRPIARSGEVIWLPPPTEISTYEAINLILHERYGLVLEQTPPDWVEKYKLPRQLPIEKRIEQLSQEIEHLKTELDTTQQQLQVETRFRKLLYEQGKDALEPPVREALQELGAHVTPPQQPGHEDGRLIDPSGRNGMLEIKGRTGTLRLSDVRQLNQWVQDAVVEENWEGKGMLIANLDLDNPPDQRGEVFPSNCVQAAQRTNICLMTTTQLFNALCSHQRNELDIAVFWDTIFDTNGLCPLPELESEASTANLEDDGIAAD